MLIIENRLMSVLPITVPTALQTLIAHHAHTNKPNRLSVRVRHAIASHRLGRTQTLGPVVDDADDDGQASRPHIIIIPGRAMFACIYCTRYPAQNAERTQINYACTRDHALAHSRPFVRETRTATKPPTEHRQSTRSP